MAESPTAHHILPLDSLKQILALAGDPVRAKEAACEQIRRLAAARVAVVVEQRGGGAVLTVQPDRGGGLVAPDVAAAFCRRVCVSPQPSLWLRERAAPGDELAALGFDNCLAVPLLAGDVPMGSLLVLDCSMADGMPSLRLTLEMLSGVLGLILRNAGVHLEAQGLAEERARQLQLSDQTLREAHRRYDELAAGIPSGVFRFRHSAEGRGAFEYVSPRFAQMLDLSQDACLSDAGAVFSRLHPADRGAFLRKSQQARGVLAAFSAEARFLVKGGAKWMLVESEPTPLADGGSVWHGVMTDIGPLKRMEAELRRSEGLYRSIAAVAPVGIFRTDAAGRCIYVNERGQSIIGLSSDEAMGEGWGRSLHPDDRERVFEEWRRAVSGKRPFAQEYRFLRPDGRVAWVLGSAVAEEGPQGQFSGFVGTITDITERKQAEEKLRLTARVFDTAQEGIMITNAECELIDVNEAFTRVTGYAREEVLGRNPRLLQSGLQDAAFYAAMWQTINRAGHWSGEMRNRRKNGEIYPEWITISAITDGRGAVTHYVGISSDITLLKQHEKRLERIAHYDALTGIPNRVLLVDRMRQALAQARREGGCLAVCYLDLDGFKPINDSHGHNAGDSVLVEIAQRIGGTLRGSDTVARLGGDEFVILLQGVAGADDCRTSLDRLLQIIARPISLQGRQFTVTASIGVTLFPLDDEDPDTLLRHADQAMYLAKQTGKNGYRLFNPRQDARLKLHQERKSRIEQGLSAGEFEMFYQPQVAMASRRVVGVEALVRWRHPQRGVLLPAEFLPLLENSELEIRVGRWIVDTALAQLERWRREGLALEAGVNIAAAHLQSPGFVENLRQTLARHPGLSPGQLQIEIRETAALADIPAVAGIIEDCLGLGVRFALDDFGTGYSSLAYLRSLPADTLKIDQSFVRNMLADKEDRAIVRGVIALARTFNRTTVAEGVETSEHFRALSEMGCDIGQGYGIAPPMPAGEVVPWCRRGSAGRRSAAC